MSIVYAPADAAPDDTARAWVAWEDKDAAGVWRPAACNAYVDNIVSENQRMRSKLLTAMRACDADGP